MTQREFQAEVYAVARSLGAAETWRLRYLHEKSSRGAKARGYRYIVLTTAGNLFVGVDENYIHCVFEYPEKANKVFPRPDHRLNPYNGKWNFCGGIRQETLRMFTEELSQIAQFQPIRS